MKMEKKWMRAADESTECEWVPLYNIIIIIILSLVHFIKTV